MKYIYLTFGNCIKFINIIKKIGKLEYIMIKKERSMIEIKCMLNKGVKRKYAINYIVKKIRKHIKSYKSNNMNLYIKKFVHNSNENSVIVDIYVFRSRLKLENRRNYIIEYNNKYNINIWRNELFKIFFTDSIKKIL